MRILSIALFCMLYAASAFGVPRINELRVDQPGPDLQEFFELSGEPGESLDDCFYLVIGDGEPEQGCGVVEELIPLQGLHLDENGLLCVAEPSSGFAHAVLRPLNFENNDSVTHLLVRGCDAKLGEDLDADDDGILDRRPWRQLLDGLALSEGVSPDCAGNERVYSSTIIQPQRWFSAAHVYRCGEEWVVGDFDWPGLSTPGSANDCVQLAGLRR